MYKHFFKRFIDIVLSLTGLVLLAIPMLAVAVIIKLDSPGPVFFKQKRVGKGKTYFMIWKFRSMPVQAPHDTPTHLLQNADAMLSKWQRFERRASIDELPQLINILRGDMSMIGPRPALWNQEDLIALRDPYGANDVRPGLTGWAQINGYRGDTSIRKRIEYDIYYIENWSMSFDFKIMFLTIFKGFINENAY